MRYTLKDTKIISRGETDMSKEILPKEATSFTKEVNNAVKDALPLKIRKILKMQKKALSERGIKWK